MNKTDLTLLIAKELNVAYIEAEKFMNLFIHIVIDRVSKKERVNIQGFGSFIYSLYKGRRGFHPKTGKPIIVSAKNIPVFKPSQKFKKTVKDNIKVL